MGDAIDRFAKALAAGSSRRQAVLGLLTGATAYLPWSAEAKKRKGTKKGQFKKYQDYCKAWCGLKFGFDTPDARSCAKKAKEGKGPCYSSSAQGPGWRCLKQDCPAHQTCCPFFLNGTEVPPANCCDSGEVCSHGTNGSSGSCV
jgi:hypothetical protein